MITSEIPHLNTCSYVSNITTGDLLTSCGGGYTGMNQSIGLGQYQGGLQNAYYQPAENKVVADKQDKLRVVRVYIADTNVNIPVGKRLLYTGEETITELTDQELFFELDIKSLLAEHNKYRFGVKDKKHSSKDNVVYLEPVRVRDLVMTVVNIATF